MLGDRILRKAVPTYSETRWWSRWEVMKQTLEGYPNVEGFLRSYYALSPATVKKLNEILNDSVKKIQLKIQLAVVIDAGSKEPTTWRGMVHWPSLHMHKIYSFISLPHYPNLTACARNQASGNATVKQQLITW